MKKFMIENIFYDEICLKIALEIQIVRISYNKLTSKFLLKVV